jgi:hypothetical protein
MVSQGTASLTLDVEDWYHIPSVCGSAFSQFRDVDEFFEKWDGRYDYIEHYPGLIDSIVDRGHEIACHGLHHSCVIDSRTKESLISPDTFRAMTVRVKRDLEK